MAFPSTAVLDNFTGTNGDDLPTYSANWSAMTNATNLEIQSNAATGTSGAGNNANYWNVSNFGPDCEAYCLVTTKPADNDVILLLARLVNETDLATADGYACRLLSLGATDTIDIVRIDNGAVTAVGSAESQEITNGDSFGFTAIGDSFQIYYKSGAGAWGTLGTAKTDATYSAAGKLGLYTDANACRIDGWGGGTIVTEPVIGTQPTDQTVYVGQTATFTIAATGAGTLSYQWYFDGGAVGTDSNSYARTNCALADNNKNVYCEVTDDNGTATSNTVKLYVLPAAPIFYLKA